MPIKFDTLAELKAFHQAFTLSEKSSDDLPPSKKRGRKPGAKNIVSADADTIPKKRGRKPGTKNVISDITDKTSQKRGRKPGTVVTSKTASRKTALLSKATASPKKPVRKPAAARQKATSSKK